MQRHRGRRAFWPIPRAWRYSLPEYYGLFYRLMFLEGSLKFHEIIQWDEIILQLWDVIKYLNARVYLAHPVPDSPLFTGADKCLTQHVYRVLLQKCCYNND